MDGPWRSCGFWALQKNYEIPEEFQKPMPHGQSSITLGLETWNLNFLVWYV
jgi:hypothetical protein